jgi:hypothetical protein
MHILHINIYIYIYHLSEACQGDKYVSEHVQLVKTKKKKKHLSDERFMYFYSSTRDTTLCLKYQGAQSHSALRIKQTTDIEQLVMLILWMLLPED